jgi:hypothetical protein
MKLYNHIVYGGCSIARMAEAGSRNYDRAIMLPRLLPEEAFNVHSTDPEDTRRLCLRLLLALRRERSRGRAGHWSYSFNRHVGLMQAYLAERRSLAQMEQGAQMQKSPAWDRAL